jgi:hypothetical protein
MIKPRDGARTGMSPQQQAGSVESSAFADRRQVALLCQMVKN